ncbi:hypothetical protein HDU67_004078 [Dinochytrium kinnereticum]|nr:hypothetical protein HDU67_004078 [Dinochytrium kinnereticum]
MEYLPNAIHDEDQVNLTDRYINHSARERTTSSREIELDHLVDASDDQAQPTDTPAPASKDQTNSAPLSISDFASSENFTEGHTLSLPALSSPSALSSAVSRDENRVSSSHPVLGVATGDDGVRELNVVTETAASPSDEVSLAVLAVGEGASPGASPTDNISLAVFAAVNPGVVEGLRREVGEALRAEAEEDDNDDDDDVPLSTYSRGDGSSLYSRYTHSTRNKAHHAASGVHSASTRSFHDDASSHHHHRRGSNASSIPSTFASPTIVGPIDANAQALAATVAHLILLRFEPWMAETSRTLRGMDQAIYALEMRGEEGGGRPVRCDLNPKRFYYSISFKEKLTPSSFLPKLQTTTDCGHDVGLGKPGTLLHDSARRYDDRVLDGRNGHPLLSIERDLQEDYLKIASSLANQQLMRAQADKASAAAAAAAGESNVQTAGVKPLLNLPGLTGEGAVPGPGQARIETVPKRQQCVRCEGFGFVHNPKSKKKHNQAKNIQCKKCLTCKLCSGTGILMNVNPCKDCGANGFLHPTSETCRLGVGCDDGCIDCQKCNGTGILDDAEHFSPTTGWIPTHGLLAHHPELRSPVGDRPSSIKRSNSRSQEVDKKAGSNANSEGSLNAVAAVNRGEEERGGDGRLTAPAGKEFSRSTSSRSVGGDAGSLNTLGNLTVEAGITDARSSAAGSGVSRSESSRSVGGDHEASNAGNELSPDRSPTDASNAPSTPSNKRRSRAMTTSSISKNPIEFIRGNLSRSGSQKSFDNGSIVTIPLEPAAGNNPSKSPFNALKTAFSRSSSTRSFTCETADETDIKNLALRPNDGSHRTLSRSTSSKSFNVEVERVSQAQTGQIAVE